MPEELTPTALILVYAELAMALGGMGVWIWCHRSRSEWRQSRLPTWDITWSNFLAMALIVLIVTSAGALLTRASLSFLAGRLAQHPVDSLLFANAGLQVSVVAAVYAALRFERSQAVTPPASPTPPLLPATLGGGKIVLAGVFTFFAALPVVALVSWLVEQIHNLLGIPLVRQELIGIFQTTDDPARFLAMTAVAVIGAPVTEELIFRAGLFRFLRTRILRWAAHLLPAALFAAAHGNVAVFAPLVTLAVIFSISYERTGRIWVPMIAHALFNLNTIVLILAGVNV